MYDRNTRLSVKSARIAKANEQSQGDVRMIQYASSASRKQAALTVKRQHEY